MHRSEREPVGALIVAVPETAGSSLYGMVDVLLAAGQVWQNLVSGEPGRPLFQVRIVSPGKAPFSCGNGIPVVPACAVADAPKADILILPELWLDPDEDLHGRYPELMAWIRHQYAAGATLYSACSGAVMLAETGLLDGCEATSHWGYRELFSKRYPKVSFRPEPNLVFANSSGRIVTAGGTTSWHDLALHIIARHGSPGEALRVAKVYLLKWHGEGQLPYAPLVRRTLHGDTVVRACEEWLTGHFRETAVIHRVVEQARVPERTLKRRFKAATGTSLIAYLQNLRIEEAKRLLETGSLAVDEISAAVSYEDPSFFRRLFKRCTGLTPSQYRRLFHPVLKASGNGPGT
ncbi:helix-turn-helix domain-containing protein [Pseudomonas lalucatii]|uniref:Helix-turn-helix domain-containing protein n=1 Tax=Pseudomonas lalucatii TaxID=1424203 RepID=A0ABS5Q1F2_9PSED|nr:helix-turn-helix domain-containing protein [Pseudomonas lalucatii]MBS7662161.1 helix-turn-helix domain-containing protein [Pseudomonas lalucatii]MBS7726074.1 helix-turn-helix domain-containing protein [Pseudomonas lalucatii]